MSTSLLHDESLTENGILICKVNNHYLKIELSSVAYIKAEGNYSKLVMNDSKTCLLSIPLKHCLEKYLRKHNFLRCHKTFVINIALVEYFSSRQKIISVSGHRIPFSRNYSKTTIVKLLLNNKVDQFNVAFEKKTNF